MPYVAHLIDPEGNTVNPLTALPPKARAAIYLAYVLIGLATGAVEVGYRAAGTDSPTWLTVALVVVPFLGAGLGLTAASNTQVVPQQIVTVPVVADSAAVAERVVERLRDPETGRFVADD